MATNRRCHQVFFHWLFEIQLSSIWLVLGLFGFDRFRYCISFGRLFVLFILVYGFQALGHLILRFYVRSQSGSGFVFSRVGNGDECHFRFFFSKYPDGMDWRVLFSQCSWHYWFRFQIFGYGATQITGCLVFFCFLSWAMVNYVMVLSDSDQVIDRRCTGLGFWAHGVLKQVKILQRSKKKKKEKGMNIPEFYFIFYLFLFFMYISILSTWLLTCENLLITPL